MEEELESMKKNEVWKLVERPSQGNIIDSKWIFKRKQENSGKTRFKARLVIRGFKDRNVYELKEVYAPVSRLSIVRSVLSIINKYGLEAAQLDVKTAFLDGEIKEDIYMEIPEGVTVPEKMKRQKVCKLQKALYGLKISPKKWYEKFEKVITNVGFKADDQESCLYVWREEGRFVIIVLYVDDMLIASNDERSLNEIKRKLMKNFEVTDLGEPKMFLGIEIKRDRTARTMTLTQEEYINKILTKFGFNDSKQTQTPMVTKKNSDHESEQKTKAIPYREAIGSLLYLTGTTRPDIAFAVGYLSRFQENPTLDNWEKIKRIFRYLNGTQKLGLKYQGKTTDLEAFSDASFADCEEAKSTGGYVLKLFGDTVAWKSKKQRCVALSTCEAEYVAMSNAFQEAIGLDLTLRRVLERSLLPITLKCDNTAAVTCATTSGQNRLRHITFITEHYVKECVKENHVK